MKKIRVSTILTAVVMALSFGLVGLKVAESAPAWAEEAKKSGSSMTVSPMNQRIVLTPGETYQGSISVSNPASSSESLKYTTEVGSFTQKMDDNNNKGSVDIDSVSSYNQIMDWITLDRTSGEVAPNTTQTIPFTVNVPADAPAGGQYATILVKGETPEVEPGQGLVIQDQTQIASILYAEVTGETKKDAQILENSIPAFLTNNPLEATSLVENDGNVHADAKYTLQVWPLFSDEEICTNEEDPATVLVMPGTKQYHAESCNLGMVGIYKARQTVEIFGEKSIVDATVIMCPIWLMVVILVVIIAIVWFVVHRIMKRKR